MAFATYSLPPTRSQSPVLFLTLFNSISRSPPTSSHRLTFLEAPACSSLCTPSLFPAFFFFKTLSCCPLYRDCLLWASGRVTGREEDGKMTQPRQFSLLSCRKYHNLSWPMSWSNSYLVLRVWLKILSVLSVTLWSSIHLLFLCTNHTVMENEVLISLPSVKLCGARLLLIYAVLCCCKYEVTSQLFRLLCVLHRQYEW